MNNMFHQCLKENYTLGTNLQAMIFIPAKAISVEAINKIHLQGSLWAWVQGYREVYMYHVSISNFTNERARSCFSTYVLLVFFILHSHSYVATCNWFSFPRTTMLVNGIKLVCTCVHILKSTTGEVLRCNWGDQSLVKPTLHILATVMVRGRVH